MLLNNDTEVDQNFISPLIDCIGLILLYILQTHLLFLNYYSKNIVKQWSTSQSFSLAQHRLDLIIKN